MKQLSFFFLFFIGTKLYAQSLSSVDSLRRDRIREANRPALQKATQQDYADARAQEHIAPASPGPSDTPQAPNAPHTDQPKASLYPSHPDPLLRSNGKKLTNAATW